MERIFMGFNTDKPSTTQAAKKLAESGCLRGIESRRSPQINSVTSTLMIIICEVELK